jgi:hypothetical protein
VDGHGRVFNSQNLTLVREMASRGCSAREIAEVIGSTASSVRVKCSQQKIRLKRGRGPSRASRAIVALPDEHTHRVPIIAYLPAPIYAQLVQRANAARKPPSDYASMLLSAVATGEIYKAVLDD